MDFIKLGKRYLIKNSNGKIITEKEKLELENKELIIQDITGCGCQGETTKKIKKNKKRIKEIMEEYKDFAPVETNDEMQNDIVEETDKFI